MGRRIVLSALGRLLNSEQNLALIPQPFEVVIRSLLRAEEVNNHIAIVQQQPLFLCTPLATPWGCVVGLLHRLENALAQGFQLPVAGAVAKDKVIGKGLLLADIE